MKRKFLSLILAGSMVASLAGCKSSDTSADASAPASDVGSTSVSTPDVEPEPTPTPDVEPEPVPTPDVEPAPAPAPDEESEPAPEPDEKSGPTSTPDEETAPAPEPDTEEKADSSLDDLIQLTESALSRGDLNYDVSAEGDGIIVSVWAEGFSDALSAAVESGFSVDNAVLVNSGEVLVLLERNILELAGAAGYGDMPVTLRVLDDRNLEQVLFVISDGEITVFEN